MGWLASRLCVTSAVCTGPYAAGVAGTWGGRDGSRGPLSSAPLQWKCAISNSPPCTPGVFSAILLLILLHNLQLL